MEFNPELILFDLLETQDKHLINFNLEIIV